MKTNRVVLLVGAAIVALLFALPIILSPSLLNASIQMLIAALFACAFNLLCGQAGMLSFGHAAYFGVGAFASIHAMEALGGTGLLPTPLLPIVGGVAGLVFGAIAGWFATKRTGTYFAMITLALAELMHALAPHLRSVFGGEAGLSSMRMPAWGFNFGDSTQQYYLTLIWVLVSLALLFLFTLTPLGRLALGLRENSHRLRFLGYDVHRLSTVVFAISAMFSGVAGGLQAINNEAANYVVFDAGVSAGVVLNSYIGGVTMFLGPALGAIIMTFFSYAVSDLTRSWLLYQGMLFVLVMMFMPTGLSGMLRWVRDNSVKYGLFRMLPVLALWIVAALLLTLGIVFLVEYLQQMFSQDYRSMASAHPGAPWPTIKVFKSDWRPGAFTTWLFPAVLLIVGSLAVHLARQAWFRLTEIFALDTNGSPYRGDGDQA